METVAALALEKRRVSCVLGEVGPANKLPKIIASSVIEQPSVSPPHQLEILPHVPFKFLEMPIVRRFRFLPYAPDATEQWQFEASMSALREVESLSREAPNHVLLGARPPFSAELSGSLSREGYDMLGFEPAFESLGRSMLNHSDRRRANLFVRCGESSIDAVVFLMGWKAWKAHYPVGTGVLVREISEFLDVDAPEAWIAFQDALRNLAGPCSDATTRAVSRVQVRGKGDAREVQEIVLERLSEWATQLNNDLRASGPYEQIVGRPVLIPDSGFGPQGLPRIFSRLLNRRLELRRLFPRKQYKPSQYLDSRLNAALGVFLRGVR